MSLREEWVLYVFSPETGDRLPHLIKGESFGPHYGPGFGGLQLGVLSKEDAQKEKSGLLTKLTELDHFPFDNTPSAAKAWILCAYVPDTFTKLNLPSGMIEGPVLNPNHGQGLGGLQLGVLSKEDAKTESRARLRKITELNDLPPWAKNTMKLAA